MTNTVDKTKGLSGSLLKIIACVTMFIDHAGYALVYQALVGDRANFDAEGKLIHNGLFFIYKTMQGIGRIAFPIFIFMLIEGYFHTHDRWKYLLRIGIFALVSEVPFDVSFYLTQREMLEGKFIEFANQNVFFTLFIGLFAVILIDTLIGLKLDIMLKGLLVLGIGGGLAYLGHVTKTDYGMVGVCAIEAAYLIRKAEKVIGLDKDSLVRSNAAAALLICAVLQFAGVHEVPAVAAIPLIAFYNGERGRYMKYTFYIFYPLHLLILGLIKFIIFE